MCFGCAAWRLAVCAAAAAVSLVRLVTLHCCRLVSDESPWQICPTNAKPRAGVGSPGAWRAPARHPATRRHSARPCEQTRPRALGGDSACPWPARSAGPARSRLVRGVVGRSSVVWQDEDCAHSPAFDMFVSVSFVIFYPVELPFSNSFPMDSPAFSRYTVTASADGFATSFSVLDFFFFGPSELIVNSRKR